VKTQECKEPTAPELRISYIGKRLLREILA